MKKSDQRAILSRLFPVLETEEHWLLCAECIYSKRGHEIAHSVASSQDFFNR
jgi:hypothetical protein